MFTDESRSFFIIPSNQRGLLPAHYGNDITDLNAAIFKKTNYLTRREITRLRRKKLSITRLEYIINRARCLRQRIRNIRCFKLKSTFECM